MHIRSVLRSSTAATAVGVTAACIIAPDATLAQPCLPYEQIVAADGDDKEFFGGSVATRDGIVAVGASRHEIGSVETGATYLFDAATGQSLRKVLANDGEDRDLFGSSVALSDGRLVVGAPGDDDLADGAGSAYIFDANTGTQLIKLLAGDGGRFHSFGTSVDISGDHVVVGASGNRSAYVFDAATGEQLFKLEPSATGAVFGFSVAIDGTKVVVGDHLADINGGDSGAAYVFDVLTGTQIAVIEPNDPEAGDLFGLSVDIEGGVVVAGCVGDGPSRGAAYAFDATTGQQLFKMLRTDPENQESFGDPVAIGDGVVLVGADSDDDPLTNAGSAYIFDASTGEQLTKLQPGNLTTSDRFGTALAVGDNTAVVGADFFGEPLAETGAAFLFDVDTCAPRFELEIFGTCPGEIEVVISNATPNGLVALEYSLFSGSFIIPDIFQCAGTRVDIGLPLLPGSPIMTTADSSGTAVITGNLGLGACGRLNMQAINVADCQTSNVGIVN